ncbi:MAG TPA: putative peptide modification system cyclase [Rhodanobacteraceae bacterium]|jgi:putative peptide modification system cyclase|nr:putative peptide modification system cyclase [Rhodanobacteraceae bacterium]
MTAEIHQLETTPGPGRMATPQLRTLVVCDIADSTALVERMGDQNAANIIRKHDRLARALIEQHHGREIDKTDGFLLMFERPIQAAAFALDYQRGLKHLSAAEGVVVRARVGIHMGDVVVWENAPEDVARGAKPTEVEGLVKPVAARLAQLARPQQILMSSAAARIAHRAEGELGHDAAERVQWKNHGRYRFKGLHESLAIVEAGEVGLAPLHAPKSGRTAKRVLPWWRRPLTLAAEAAMLAIAIGVSAWFLLQSPPTLAFAARDWVVVGNVQNHTNQQQLGTPLDAAFKIGLEQSQYVNVIPDMQVDNALKRMEKPVGTPVNRTIGADVAMREGARALILPSLAQVGGRIQISAEVIDPHTGVTVYSDSTQADGEQQILPATDKLLGKLRSRLGESLASIQKTSMPLQQITTSNIDALRAFAEAESAYGQGKINEALALLRQATTIDPDFAMAWARVATLQNAFLNDPAASYASLQKAEANRDRLSTRERLTVDATIGQYADANKWISNWQALTQLYPDDSGAQQNVGLGFWWYEHRLSEAIPHFLAVAHSRNPLRGLSWYSLAMIEMERNDYKMARGYLEQGRKLGMLAPHYEDVGLDLALRDYKAVLARLDAAPKRIPPSIEAAKLVRLAAVAVEQGRDADARGLLDKAEAMAPATAKPQRARIALARAALDFSTGTTDAKLELTHIVNDESTRIAQTGPAVDGSAAIHLALAAMLAVRNDQPALARKALDSSRELALNHGYYDRAALWNTADCETQYISALKDRIACLAKLVDGHEYFQTHVALMLAYEADKDADGARQQAKWLEAHRGQAIAELENEPALIPNLLALQSLEATAHQETSSVH